MKKDSEKKLTLLKMDDYRESDDPVKFAQQALRAVEQNADKITRVSVVIVLKGEEFCLLSTSDTKPKRLWDLAQAQNAILFEDGLATIGWDEKK